MRILSIIALVGMLLPSVAFAQDASSSSSSVRSPYPFFRRMGTSSSATTSSVSSASYRMPSTSSVQASSAPVLRSVPAPAVMPEEARAPETVSRRAVDGQELVDYPKIIAHLEPDRSDASASDEVVYWVCIKSLYNQRLKSFQMAFYFNRAQMRILSTGGGVLQGDKVVFTVPSLDPGEEYKMMVRVKLAGNLRPGAVVTTYGSMIWDGNIFPACAKHELAIIAIERAVTGVGDGTSPVEDLRRFLRPIGGGAAAGVLPLLLGTFAVAGVGIGVGVGKKYL